MTLCCSAHIHVPTDTDSSAQSRSVPSSVCVWRRPWVCTVYCDHYPALTLWWFQLINVDIQQSIMSGMSGPIGWRIKDKNNYSNCLYVWLNNRLGSLWGYHVMEVILACVKVCIRIVTSPMVSMGNYPAITQTGLSGLPRLLPWNVTEMTQFQQFGEMHHFQFIVEWQSAVTVVGQKQTSVITAIHVE